MKFKTENLWLFVEGIQFRNGVYSTTNENEIKLLKKYVDSISIIAEEKTVKPKKSE
ncbi:hypothetical protein JOC70_000700 [Clostridium pascui]|uniref:hypothetical protein n=1 Tax=Clostridium pascui TaxID=46609 RepID=UPI00195CB09A|nr:hypothetical protein [Clostridium pascui]MBM7869231.1 hypothetical protein [Clostridium pascui]